MEQKTERQGRAYAGNCDPKPQGLARDPAQAVRNQKGKLKDPLSVMGVPSERGSCDLYSVLPPQNQAVLGSIWQYLTTAKNEKPAKLRIFNVTSRVLYGAREGTRTPKDKPHAPQTCASASSATLAYSVHAVHPTPEV